MKKNRFNMSVKGIKCDACSYKDMTVPYEDYPNWLNKPCPECGANLLTEADYKALNKLMSVTNFLNRIFPAKEENPDAVPITFVGEANGTGEIVFKHVKPEQEKK